MEMTKNTRCVFVVLGAVLAPPQVLAKTPPRIAEIKRLYKDVAAQIKAKKIKSGFIQAKAMVPGIGEQGRDVTFYHRADGSLAKVHTSYNVTVRNFETQYLFDAQGRLAFSYAKSDDAPYCGNQSFAVLSQERLYFSKKGKLVRYLLKRTEPKDPEGDNDDGDYDDEDEDPCVKKLYAGRRADRGFTRKELAIAKRVRARGAFLTKLYATFKKSKAKARGVLGGKDVDEKL